MEHCTIDELEACTDSILEATMKQLIELKSALEELVTYMTHHDELTGLPNRKMYMSKLEESMSQTQTDRITAVILMGLDNFKSINDNLGHEIGDEFLQSFAMRIKGIIRPEETISRLGGDEFILLSPNMCSMESVANRCRELIDALLEPYEFNRMNYYIGVSLGVSCYPDHGQAGHELVKHADIAMHKAKELGRNSFCMYEPSFKLQVKERLDLERLLQKALDHQEFFLEYQPKVHLGSGIIYGTEALIRWQSPELGLVRPHQFIPVAEQNGLIEPISNWVLRTACMQNKAWQDKGYRPIMMSVNISSRDFQADHWVGSVLQTIHETGLNPKWVELEITESGLMKNPQQCVRKLQQLKNADISISIDDFGTGYSSLSHLKALPVDYLKIDRCFMNEIQTSSRDRAITHSIITLAQNLNIAVVAEGIENEEQLKVLLSMNCEYGQGYYYGYPQGGNRIEQLLDNTLGIDEEG